MSELSQFAKIDYTIREIDALREMIEKRITRGLSTWSIDRVTEDAERQLRTAMFAGIRAYDLYEQLYAEQQELLRQQERNGYPEYVMIEFHIENPYVEFSNN